MPQLYNAIYATFHPTIKINNAGYAETKSGKLATMIWSMVSDWESLITKEKSAKQLVTRSVIHRLTGRKDVVTILNIVILYDAVLKQNEAWSQMVQQSECWANSMAKGIATHVTLDNNDGRQETTTGAGTTHGTNFTIFQPILKAEICKEMKLSAKNFL